MRGQDKDGETAEQKEMKIYAKARDISGQETSVGKRHQWARDISGQETSVELVRKDTELTEEAQMNRKRSLPVEY